MDARGGRGSDVAGFVQLAAVPSKDDGAHGMREGRARLASSFFALELSSNVSTFLLLRSVAEPGAAGVLDAAAAASRSTRKRDGTRVVLRG